MATQGARTDDHALIVERYRKLLSELVGNAGSTGARRSDWPDSLLPETRERISAALARTLIDNPDQQTLTRHEALSSLLQRFRPHREVVSEFIATLVTTPSLIAVAYGVWLGIRGDGWAWLAAAFGFAASWFVLLTLHFSTPERGWLKGIGGALLGSAAGLICLVTTAGIWLRLVVGGALGGLYQSVFVQFDIVGLMLACTALWVGWYSPRRWVRCTTSIERP